RRRHTSWPRDWSSDVCSSDLPRHVLGGSASTWSRAAELAERALRSLEYSDERRGFDAYGWADTAHALPPPPARAVELLDALFAAIGRASCRGRGDGRRRGGHF